MTTPSLWRRIVRQETKKWQLSGMADGEPAQRTLRLFRFVHFAGVVSAFRE
jgi:hypothetical protein